MNYTGGPAVVSKMHKNFYESLVHLLLAFFKLT